MDRIEIKTDPAPPMAPTDNAQPPITSGSVPAVPSSPQADDVRPSWLPEKFKNPEDLAKAYSELESRFTQTAQAGDALQEAVKAGNLTLEDIAPMSREFAETGDISDKSYKMLEKRGIPRELVDAYVEGQRALADAQVNSVYSTVGGQQSYEQMTSWAADNLPPEEVEAFDNIVETGSQAAILMAVRGLHARYSAAAGSPRLIQGNSASSGSSAYRSLAEVTAAMRDPRYKNDPAYRKDVEDRLRVSDVFGGKR
jgi:hypothetical protein